MEHLEQGHQDYFEIRWKNFKSFKDTQWIKVKPLTVVIGTNNSGKTNLLAPFLLMNQTLSSRDRSSALILRGENYDAGDVQEVVHNYELGKDIFFGFRYHVHTPTGKLDKVGSYSPGGFEFTVEVTPNHEMILKEEVVKDIFGREFFRLTKSGKGFIYTGLDESILKASEFETIGKSEPLNFLFSPNSFLSAMYNRESANESKKEKASKSKKEGSKEETKRKVNPFSRGFSNILDAVAYNYSLATRHLGELTYVGPIREAPRRVYEVANEDYATVGSRGENTAGLLKRHQVKHQAALNDWVKRFGFGDGVVLKSLHGNLYSIRFTKEGTTRYTNIANAGFGASQVLPLIVQAIVGGKRRLTIAEQPEIHLNPKLQCELADLFALMIGRGQKVLVETHSEHLLLRLRRLVASKKISANDVAVYFVSKQEDQSVIQEIRIEDDGHIKDEQWPVNFFDDTLRESMGLATEQMRSASKK